MRRGRKKGSSLFAKPERATWEEIRSRIIYGSTEWRLTRLRQLIEQYKAEQAKAIGDPNLPDNWLSDRDKTIRADIFTEIDWLWRELSAEFQRTVMDGDAGWFKRHAKAIEHSGLPEPARFNAKVIYLIELAWWGTDAKRDNHLEGTADELGLTRLTPAGKFSDAMASHIWKAVVNAALEEPETRSLIDQQVAAGESYGFKTTKRHITEQVVAESFGFKTKERAMDAIHDIATRLKFALKKQARNQWTDSLSVFGTS
jgi:hypothetical protein